MSWRQSRDCVRLAKAVKKRVTPVVTPGLRLRSVADAIETASYGVECSLPKERHNLRFEDKRKLRHYSERWKNRTHKHAWLLNFRRIQVCYDRILTMLKKHSSISFASS